MIGLFSVLFGIKRGHKMPLFHSNVRLKQERPGKRKLKVDSIKMQERKHFARNKPNGNVHSRPLGSPVRGNWLPLNAF